MYDIIAEMSDIFPKASDMAILFRKWLHGTTVQLSVSFGADIDLCKAMARKP